MSDAFLRRQFLEILQTSVISNCLCGFPYKRKEIARIILNALPFERKQILVMDKDEICEVEAAEPPEHLYPCPDRDAQLLSSTLLRLIAETVLKSTYLCSEVIQLAKQIASEDILNFMVNLMVSSNDHHLNYSLRKVMVLWIIVMESENRDKPCVHDKYLIEAVFQNLSHSKKTATLLLEVFRELFVISPDDFHCLTKEETFPNYPGCTKHERIVPYFIKIRHHYLETLIEHWTDLALIIKQNSCTENEEQETVFLELWYHLLCSKEQHELSHLEVLFAKPYIGYLLSITSSSISFKSSIDVIYKALFCNSQQEPKENSAWLKAFAMEIMNAVCTGWMDQVPLHNTFCGFCGPIETASNSVSQHTTEEPEEDDDDDFPKCDIVMLRKITVVILKALSILSNEVVPCESVISTISKLEEWVMRTWHGTKNKKEEPIHTWVVQLFLDQDDQLFEAMFSCLQLYSLLKTKQQQHSSQDKENGVAKCVEDLNPHKTFLKLLLVLGQDHDPLLDFLMSNETSMLLYFLHLIKLVLNEWEVFVTAHGKSRSSHNLHEGDAERSYGKESEANLEATENNSAGQSSEDPSREECLPNEHTENLTQDVDSTMAVLIRLRLAIQRQVSRGIFPYAIQPLLNLIEKCEKKYES